jgi:hypothetical protein
MRRGSSGSGSGFGSARARVGLVDHVLALAQHRIVELTLALHGPERLAMARHAPVQFGQFFLAARQRGLAVRALALRFGLGGDQPFALLGLGREFRLRAFEAGVQLGALGVGRAPLRRAYLQFRCQFGTAAFELRRRALQLRQPFGFHLQTTLQFAVGGGTLLQLLLQFVAIDARRRQFSTQLRILFDVGTQQILGHRRRLRCCHRLRWRRCCRGWLRFIELGHDPGVGDLLLYRRGRRHGCRSGYRHGRIVGGILEILRHQVRDVVLGGHKQSEFTRSSGALARPPSHLTPSRNLGRAAAKKTNYFR